jgi:DNA-binding MarR family transcriptional regulator
MTQMKRKDAEFLERLLASMSDPYYLSFRVIALGELVTRESDEAYAEELGVGIKELRVLRIARLQPGQPVQIVGKWSFVEKAAMSKLVSTLCNLGYLERRINPRDARSTLLFVTKDGAALLRTADRLAHKLMKKKFPSLSPEVVAMLTETLDTLLLDCVKASTAQTEARQKTARPAARPAGNKRIGAAKPRAARTHSA